MDSKLKYYLQLADSAMIMSKRLLEERIQLTDSSESNQKYALKLEEFANELYLETSTWGPDNKLNYSLWLGQRKSNEFYNCLLVEISTKGTYSRLVQQFFFETYEYLVLLDSFLRNDPFLKQIAEKYLPAFHEQMLITKNSIEKLYNSPAEIKLKIQENVIQLWKYVEDLFQVSVADIEMCACQTGVDFAELRINWETLVSRSLETINVSLPVFEPLTIIGKEGQHTANLDHFILKNTTH
jgi:1,2-phenylacetyl-CoA epoxidase catalytic subunit